MDGRIPRRAYACRHSARRLLVPAARVDLVFPADLSFGRTPKILADVSRPRPFRYDRFSLRGGCATLSTANNRRWVLRNRLQPLHVSFAKAITLASKTS